MEINDLAKILLVISLSFSMVGISIQIMRLLGTANDTVKLSHEIIRNVTRITTKLSDDYLALSDHILTLTQSVSRIGTNVIDPIVGLFGFLDRFGSHSDGEDD